MRKILIIGRHLSELSEYERTAAERGSKEPHTYVRIDPRSAGEHLALCRGHRPDAVLIRREDKELVLPAVRDGHLHVAYLRETVIEGVKCSNSLHLLADDSSFRATPVRSN